MILKRFCAMMLCLVLCLTSVSWVYASGYDVNNDGSEDMKDVLVIRKFLAGMQVPITKQEADVNQDGSADMKDVLAVRRHLMHFDEDVVVSLTSDEISSRPGYFALTADERTAYTAIVNAIEDGKYTPATVTISGHQVNGLHVDMNPNSDNAITVDELDRVMEAIQCDQVEFFFMKSHYGYNYVTINGKDYCSGLNIEFNMSQSDVAAAETRLANVIQVIVNEAPKNDVFACEKYLHDKICAMCDYDYDTAHGTSQASALAYSAYGALIRGKAVCTGYTLAMQLLCNYVNIPCYHIRGIAQGGDHMWNIIYLTGYPYFLDVTWDDDEDSGPLYSYFNVTDEILDYRQITQEFPSAPQCSATEYNYFVYNQCYTSTNAPTFAAKLMAKAIKSGKNSISMKTTASGITAIKNWLNDGYKVYDDVNALLSGSGKSMNGISYILDEEMNIFYFMATSIANT
ncbi:MAG: hypothetical protein J6Z00_01625 [Clostridia bacterium]|nr:hypothetical protein [Clostridia bacterium]